MSGVFSKVSFPSVGNTSLVGDPVGSKVQETIAKKVAGDTTSTAGLLAGGATTNLLNQKLKQKFGE
jgi:hypothetical protein